MKTEDVTHDLLLGEMKKIDFNSVVYFMAVMKYRTIYNASIVLKCSSPSVSIKLKRFCSYYNSPLFEKKGRLLKPTSHAKNLYVVLEQMFSDTIVYMHENDDNNIRNSL